jgi:VIT family
MVASALSMGFGTYLAAKSEREIFEAEYAGERNPPNQIEVNGLTMRETVIFRRMSCNSSVLRSMRNASVREQRI